MCDQQSLRLACAYTQSDQSLCLSLEYPMSVRLLTEHHLRFLSLTEGCRGSSESTHVKMSHCWKSHALAQTGRVAQSVTCLATDASLDADPGVASSIPARSHTFVEIDHEIISTVIRLPSAESFKKGCCQIQAKVCAQSTG